MKIDFNIVASVVVGLAAYNILLKALGATFLKMFLKSKQGEKTVQSIKESLKDQL